MQQIVEATETETVADKFIESSYDENGVFNGIKFKNADTFNFAFDCVDAIAAKSPDKLAMMWVGNDKTDRKFTFSDMKKYSAKTANYFESLGIKKGLLLQSIQTKRRRYLTMRIMAL